MSLNTTNFAALYQQYKSLVYNATLSYVQNIEDAEEITQDVFIQLHQSMDGFKNQSSLKTCIYRITINKSLDFLKHKKSQKRFFIFGNRSENEYEIHNISNFEHPCVLLENQEKFKILFRVINELAENQKTTFILSKIDELSNPEIASIMELTVSSQKSLLFRAKDNLKKKQMKRNFFYLSILLFASCQVTETIYINEDKTGKIETEMLRNEQSFMQLAGEYYSKEEKFVDSTYVFDSFITKYSENFFRLPASEQDLFNKYKTVNVYIKKSSYDKEFRTTIWQNFKTIKAVPDLYKTEDYADDLEHNYALSAENHYYEVSYTLDGTIFKRKVKITNPAELKMTQDKIDDFKKQYSKLNLIQTYTLNYHFFQKIKSTSNSNAKISEDRKSLLLQFVLSDCLQNPEITNLEVLLE